jgi:hypothetical protein
MYDISIIVPGIRPHYWNRLYNSIEGACKQYSWELICGGPFEPPKNMLKLKNFKYLSSYSPVPVVIQQATLLADSVFICHQVDDGVLLSDSLDECITQFKNYNFKDILNLRYSERIDSYIDIRPAEFWAIKNDVEFNLPFINQSWYTSVQPLMYKELFTLFGGFDCRFEYSNHCHHDFMFRIQNIGGKIIPSSCGVCCADHMPEETGDHKPVHNAQLNIDTPVFKELWSHKRESIIDYNNWKKYDKPWTRRFKKSYLTYEEMILDQ